MSEPAPAPHPSPAPSPAPAPAAAVQRPEWLPEAHWDGEKNAIKDDFGAHYAEVATFHKTETEKRAALAARKPEDIKFDAAALPKELHEEAKKAGIEIKIDEKDPRIPAIRQMAIEHGWDDGVVGKLVALDAQMKLQAHTAEMQRVKDEDKKLGENVKARKEAVTNWIKGLTTKGDLTAEEADELRMTAATAAGVSLIEKLIAKAAGTVPGNTTGNSPPPKPAEIPQEQRWYGNTMKQKVS